MARTITVQNLCRTATSVGKKGVLVPPGGTIEVDEDDPKVIAAIAAKRLAVRSTQEQQVAPLVIEPTVTVADEPPTVVSTPDPEVTDEVVPDPEVVDEAPKPAPVRKTSKPKEGS